MEAAKDLKHHLLNLLSFKGAHLGFDKAVEGFPPESRGIKPRGVPHSAWELLEHLRIAQWDILEFSRNPHHISPRWPEGYWPGSEAPPNDQAWNDTAKQFRRDLEEMKKLISETKDEKLFAKIPHGKGQTLLRQALLVADHNSYHLGQLMFLRKMLEGK